MVPEEEAKLYIQKQEIISIEGIIKPPMPRK
jgi:hypothetical protein